MSYKYEPLEIYLENIPSTKREVTLTFREVERILGARLPASAFKYREWWANQSDTSNRPHARAWANATFVVDAVDQGRDSGWVRFLRR